MKKIEFDGNLELLLDEYVCRGIINKGEKRVLINQIKPAINSWVIGYKRSNHAKAGGDLYGYLNDNIRRQVNLYLQMQNRFDTGYNNLQYLSIGYSLTTKNIYY